MNCPDCGVPTYLEPYYKDNICKNKSCSLFLKGDVKAFILSPAPCPLEAQIQEIIECFEFEKIHKVMTFLNWQWRDEGVPSLEKIKQYAEAQLRECIKNSQTNHTESYVSCGGFTSTYCPKEKFLHLNFALDQWTAEPPENN